MKSILFVGNYPNNVNIYRNVFFRNLIFAIADLGVNCVVISPVSVTKYLNKTKDIPRKEIQFTPNGNSVEVYYPRVISASSKQIGKYNTERLSETLFEQGALKVALKLNREFDAVYGHFFLYGGLAAIKIGRKLQIPSFVAFGECDYESQIQKTYGDLKFKDIYGLSGVVAVSTKNANRLKKLGIFENIPVIIAPNAVDNSLFCKMDKDFCRDELGMPKDKFIVGFVGGFIERKGDKRLLKAVNMLDDVYIAFAGRGSNPPRGEKVLFCKSLTHEQIPLLLNSVDTFCLPTLSEGSCNAVAEALACGVPVISSNLSFNDDFLDDSNSIRINPASVEEIKNAIKKIQENDLLRKRLSQSAYNTGVRLNIIKRAEKIVDFIDSIINSN